jgi:uncharacterized membrane protein YfcA
MKTALFIALTIFGAIFLAVWGQEIFRKKSSAVSGASGGAAAVAAAATSATSAPQANTAGGGAASHAGKAFPSVIELLIGFCTNFFDTLGIGSFATTSAILKLKSLIADEDLPGTLNVGHCLPSMAQAFIFIAIVQVDITTLICMILASVIGAWSGAGLVSKLPRKIIQLSLGIALLGASMLMLVTHPDLKLAPAGGLALSLQSWRLAVGIAGNFFLGALMTLGIGLFAPCMILVSLLGMDPHAAFPIMMGSCAFLMPVGGIRFIRTGRYNLRTSMGLTLGGIPGVLIAAYLVKSLPLNAVRWLVIIVVVYTAISMLRSAVARKAP